MDYIETLKNAIVTSRNFPEGEASDLYVVWFSKTLQNAKALFSTDAVHGVYFEVTMNGDQHEIYVVRYIKESNTCVTF